MHSITDRLNPVLERYPLSTGVYIFGLALDYCRSDSDIVVGLIIANEEKYKDRDRELLTEKIVRDLSPLNEYWFDVVILKSSEALFSFRVISGGALEYVKDLVVVTDFIEKVSHKYREVYPRYRNALEMIVSEG
ncbi:MAG: hypothetical protein R6U91_06645 [Bacillota bacterium]